MTQRTKILLKNLIQVLILVVAVILLWYVAAFVADSELILPQPHAVLKLTFELLGEGQTYVALLFTVLRALASFALSLAVAILLSLCVGLYAKSRFYVDAVVSFLRSVPTISIILITLILFNSSLVPIVVAFLVAFPIVYSVCAREFDKNGKLLDVCKVYGVSPAKKVRYALLPLIAQELPTQCKDTLPLCIKVVVAGEVLALPLKGIGRQMYVGKVNLETASVLALTLLTLVVCFAISGAVSLWQRKKI